MSPPTSTPCDPGCASTQQSSSAHPCDELPCRQGPSLVSLAGALLFFCTIVLSQGQKYEKLYDSSQHDLRAYLACAHNILAGRHMYKTHHQAIPEDPTLTGDVPQYLYPPLLGALMIPATVMSYDTFKHIWFFLSFFFVLHGVFLAVSILPFQNNRAIAFLLVGGLMLGSDMFLWLLHAAQADALTIWLSTLSLWLFEKKRWFASAVLISLAAWIKITPGIFFVFLLTRGPRKFAWVAISAGLLLGLAQITVFPGEFLYFFTDNMTPKIPNPMRAPYMQSLWSLSELLMIPDRGREIFDAQEQFKPTLWTLKIVVSLFTAAVILRKKEGTPARFIGFAVCCSASVLITDLSWMMRFIWNYIPIVAILYVVSSVKKNWQRGILIPFGIFLLLLNLDFVWKDALGKLLGWKAIFIAGPALHALFGTVFLGIVSIADSSWIPPVKRAIQILRVPTKRWLSKKANETQN